MGCTKQAYRRDATGTTGEAYRGRATMGDELPPTLLSQTGTRSAG